MPAIHFVERVNHVHKLPDDSGDWESGYWVIGEDIAEKLVGGDLYLHSGQSEPSHFGGRILGWRVHRGDEDVDGRIVFRIRPSMAHKNMVTKRLGWGKGKKLDW